jgi:hypothetical protein
VFLGDMTEKRVAMTRELKKKGFAGNFIENRPRCKNTPCEEFLDGEGQRTYLMTLPDKRIGRVCESCRRALCTSSA